MMLVQLKRASDSVMFFINPEFVIGVFPRRDKARRCVISVADQSAEGWDIEIACDEYRAAYLLQNGGEW